MLFHSWENLFDPSLTRVVFNLFFFLLFLRISRSFSLLFLLHQMCYNVWKKRRKRQRKNNLSSALLPKEKKKERKKRGIKGRNKKRITKDRISHFRGCLLLRITSSLLLLLPCVITLYYYPHSYSYPCCYCCGCRCSFFKGTASHRAAPHHIALRHASFICCPLPLPPGHHYRYHLLRSFS